MNKASCLLKNKSKRTKEYKSVTLPLPVPSPDEKGGGLGMGLATPPHQKAPNYRNVYKNYSRHPISWERRSFAKKTDDAMW